jgi:hypothetical protein
MVDYTATFMPGQQWTSIASGDIESGDPLEVAGSGSVRRVTTAASDRYVGIAAKAARDSALCVVISAKVIHDGIAEGAITAGDSLSASAVDGHTVVTYDDSAAGGVPPHSHPEYAIVAHNHNAAYAAIDHTHAASGAERQRPSPPDAGGETRPSPLASRRASPASVAVIGMALTTAADGGTVRWMQR